MNIKSLFIMYFTLLAGLFGWQENATFFVPDSIIYQASSGEINFEDKLVGFPLWTNGVPDTVITHPQDMLVYNRSDDHNEFGLNRAINYIETPNVLVIPTENTGPNPAMVIFPGGAFKRSVLDKEGIDVAQRLRKHGITGVVVNYRNLPETWWNAGLFGFPDSVANAMYDDVKRGIRVIRQRAAEFNIDPDKIGVMGFSAGGVLAARLVSDTLNTPSALNDATDAVSCRPNFACLTYPVMVDSVIQAITPNAAPSFLVSAKNDGSAPTVYVQQFYDSLRAKGVEAEFALFQTGGHGFGLGVDGGEVTQWPGMLVDWLYEMGMSPLPSAVSDWQEAVVPSASELYQNYPNPFNPKTVIRYQLPVSIEVKLVVYNLAGQKVTTLVDGAQSAGLHQVVWDAAMLPSGLYFYKLQAGAFSEIKRMILFK